MPQANNTTQEASTQASPEATPGAIKKETKEKKKADAFNELSEMIAINKSQEDIDDRRKQGSTAIHVAGRLALTGQITVFFAGPGTGKTLLSLYLVSEAIAAGMKDKKVYHLNLDDSYEGLTQKGELGLQRGFQVVSPETFPFPQKNFEGLVDYLIDNEISPDTIIILDTIKKFVDVMNKSACSNFMTMCRRFTSSGGTIIALAHTNKNKGTDDISVPGGTSDILDDCDCAYTIDLVKTDENKDDQVRTVVFQQQKARGPVVQNAVYEYTTFEDGDYNRMFESVKQIDGNDADEARRIQALTDERERDAPLIKHITKALTQGPKLQKDLVSEVYASGVFSIEKIIQCLKRWSISASPELGLWSTTNAGKNCKQYQLAQNQ